MSRESCALLSAALLSAVMSCVEATIIDGPECETVLFSPFEAVLGDLDKCLCWSGLLFSRANRLLL